MNQNQQEKDVTSIAPVSLTEKTANAAQLHGDRWLSAFSIGIVVVYGLMFLLFFQHMGPKDHDQFLVFHELQYWNASLFGLAKQWTPLMCSGLSLAGEPQVPFMSLSMMLTYVLGPLWGLKLATLLYFVAGWVGAYLYAGLWLKQSAVRTLAAALFIGNGYFFCRLGFGHIDFIPFLILPLMLWALHRVIDWAGNITWSSVVRLLIVTLLMAAGIAMAIDGSPVAIIHLLFWIGLYAVVLSFTVGSWAPLIVLGSATLIAVLLDAGYLWPMLESQAMFPRRTPDRFTSFLSLIWFALLPVRGKLLPANGNGHELSVFIGPILAWLIWRYRHWLNTSLPSAMKHPLVIVSVVSIILGMGSLKPLHIPTWLSLFDLLRPLPGFRSMGVTGRYWGFLALPLSLLSAAALARFVYEHHDRSRARLLLSFALLLQLGFQTETVMKMWLHSPTYQPQDFHHAFQHGPESIEYVTADPRRQGELITPTRGVADCYNEDDFIKARVDTGNQLVRGELRDGADIPVQSSTQAGFVTWSHIRLLLDAGAPALAMSSANDATRLQLVLNQAFHPWWQADGCRVDRNATDNLIVDCPLARWRAGAVELKFNDTVSTQAAGISIMAWRLWIPSVAGLILLSYFWRRKPSASVPM